MQRRERNEISNAALESLMRYLMRLRERKEISNAA